MSAGFSPVKTEGGYHPLAPGFDTCAPWHRIEKERMFMKRRRAWRTELVFSVYRFEFALHSFQKQICQGHLNKPRLDSRGALPNIAKCFWPSMSHSAHLAGWKDRIHALLNQVCLKEYINSNTSFSFESGRVEVRAHIIQVFKWIHLIFLNSEGPDQQTVSPLLFQDFLFLTWRQHI